MHTIFIHPSLRIQHTFNLFHGYTYISHWGSERQSPSLEIIFDLVLTCTGVHPLSGQNPCPYDEGGANQWTNAVHLTRSLHPLPERYLTSLTSPTPISP